MAEITLHAAAEAAAPAAGACPTCNAWRTREFCAECGQPVPRGRLTLRSVATKLLADAVDLDRGLLFTFLELFRHPGVMVRRYLGGATVNYANPVKYFLMIGALTTLVSVQSGLAGQVAAEFAQSMREGSRGELNPRAGSVLEFISSYFTLLMAFTLPTTALASRLAFRRAGYNYAEHLVFSTYVGAQQCTLMIGALVAGTALGGNPGAWLQASILPAVLYHVWAAAQLVDGPRVPTLLRATWATTLSFVLFTIVGFVTGVLFGVALAVAQRG